MQGWFRDIRYGLRTLFRTPTFAALVIFTLALGIGANTTVFSWINSTLLNPIPGASHTRALLSVTRGGPAETPYPLSYLDYTDLRDGTQSLSGLAAFCIQSLTLTGGGHPERIWGSLVSANYFDVLGVEPTLGHGFRPEEDQKPGGSPFAVISYRFWQYHFGANPAVIGRIMYVNQHPFTIVGVAPPRFQGSQTGLQSDVWIPLAMQQQIVFESVDLLHDRTQSWLLVAGRLKPRMSAQQAENDLNILMQRINTQYPEAHKGHNTLTIYPLWRAPFGANEYLYILLPTLMAIAGIVLLLTCTNVANLLLVRSVGRRREIAVRLSLGASRWLLMRQSLSESMLLALLGGAVALLMTRWTAGTLTKLIPPSGLPVSMDAHLDGNVLLTTVVISILTGLLFGVLPALRSSKLFPLAALKEENGRTSGGFHKARLAGILAVVQISLSFFLLVCAGLFIRSFQKAQVADTGFNSEHVLLGSFDLLPSAYNKDQGLQFQRQLLANLQALPGVQSASLATSIPLSLALSSITIKVEGYTAQQNESMDIDDNWVAPDYLHTMQIPLTAGREFTLDDTPKSPSVVVVNQALVDRYWPHQEAIGKRISIGNEWYSVVGVARNSNYTDLNEAPKPFLYLSLFQAYSRQAIVYVRIAGDPAKFAPTLEKTFHNLNADLPLFDVDTLKSRVQVASTIARIAGIFVGNFGLLALTLAAIGIYGVVSYTARQRTHEIGIRLALGATRFDILRLVINQGAILCAIGLLIGLAISFVLTRFLSSILFGVGPTDVLSFAGVAVLLALVALLACYLPAQRAMRVDPMIALRYE